jgi:hypothetical protein
MEFYFNDIVEESDITIAANNATNYPESNLATTHRADVWRSVTDATGEVDDENIDVTRAGAATDNDVHVSRLILLDHNLYEFEDPEGSTDGKCTVTSYTDSLGGTIGSNSAVSQVPQDEWALSGVGHAGYGGAFGSPFDYNLVPSRPSMVIELTPSTDLYWRVVISNPDSAVNYLQIGKLILSDHWVLDESSCVMTYKSNSAILKARGGQMYSNPLHNFTKYSVEFRGVNLSAMLTLNFAYQRFGDHSPFACTVRPSGTGLNESTLIYARFTSFKYTSLAQERFNISIELEEVL